MINICIIIIIIIICIVVQIIIIIIIIINMSNIEECISLIKEREIVSEIHEILFQMISQLQAENTQLKQQSEKYKKDLQHLFNEIKLTQEQHLSKICSFS